jgi:hypothetical protein
MQKTMVFKKLTLAYLKGARMMEWILGLLAVAIGGLLWVGWHGND